MWSGTAFNNCAGNTITLLHNFFTASGGDVKMCNDGAIVARSVGVEGNNYTSQLNINVTYELGGETVMCAYDDGTSGNTVQFEAIIPDIGIIL